MKKKNGNGNGNGSPIILSELNNKVPVDSEINMYFIRTRVPIDYYINELLSKLSPRTTQSLLRHYANKMDDLI